MNKTVKIEFVHVMKSCNFVVFFFQLSVKTNIWFIMFECTLDLLVFRALNAQGGNLSHTNHCNYCWLHFYCLIFWIQLILFNATVDSVTDNCNLQIITEIFEFCFYNCHFYNSKSAFWNMYFVSQNYLCIKF